MTWSDHLVILPILLPLAAGALAILLDGRVRHGPAAVNLLSTLGLLAIAWTLAWRTLGPGSLADGAQVVRVYLLGDWPSSFGIVLVLDRLSATMLALSATLSVGALVFSLARWHRMGQHFHPLFQFLLMGVNGAFLTGDIFNLFVFFEVMLAASYGLALHGSGEARVKAGMHYIAVNLVASLILLIGASLVYAAAGTLGMADLAMRAPLLDERNRTLLEMGGAALSVAFLVKAAMWPLGLWLPAAYSTAAAPIAAMFAIMTKVGVYALLRFGWLLSDQRSPDFFNAQWLMIGGLATIAFGSLGALASREAPRVAAFLTMVSSGTLLTVVSIGDPSLITAALYYLVSSTLAAGALFCLAELAERGLDERKPAEDQAELAVPLLEAYGLQEEEPQDEEVGVPVPAVLAVLGIGFLACTLLMAGLPPLSGFIAKFAILRAMFETGHTGRAWIVTAALLLSGFATLAAMTRLGMRLFWSDAERPPPKVRVIEAAPVALLLLCCVALTAQAGPAMAYLRGVAEGLSAPSSYIEAVRNAPRMREALAEPPPLGGLFHQEGPAVAPLLVPAPPAAPAAPAGAPAAFPPAGGAP
ncbi:monovalent cation/H+ antiporter subunit D [Neomegalonema sp.]|uniref:monovalent cation/H+ antiporter subunit D n=1 Tax=Neomegalonema sp. TaxID=2039713 RepID=UPI0026208A7B|nr:monovalent cation/H+ antiporter subunit D [Neomegalonema sp.]MDD2868524.1 monovalent cation/H+ antiporter subunit D [Neomegalonema sp.]